MRTRRKVGLLFSGILLVVCIVLAARPTIVIELSEEFDPLSTQVRVGGKILEPAGAGGQRYSTRVWPGTHTLSVKGKFVQETSRTVSSMIGKKTIKISAEKRPLESIIKGVLGQEQIAVYDGRVFGSQWLIARITGSNRENKDGDTEFPVLLRYNPRNSDWELGSADNTDWILEMPIEARSYYESLSED